MPQTQHPRRGQAAIALVAYSALETELRVPEPSLAAYLLRSLELEPGFVDLFACFNESAGELVCVSIWEAQGDTEHYEVLSSSAIEKLRWMLESA